MIPCVAEASLVPKVIENLTSHETGPNSKNHTPGRPKVDFYSISDDFWQYLCDHFSYIFSYCEQLVFEQQYNTLATFSPATTSPFGINFLIKCSSFFLRDLHALHFFNFMLISYRKVRFRGPSRPLKTAVWSKTAQ